MKSATKFAVRSIGLALVVSVALLTLEPGTAVAGGWVRTSDGWEREEALRPRPYVYEPAIHPLVLASFVSLASVMALVAFSTADAKSAA